MTRSLRINERFVECVSRSDRVPRTNRGNAARIEGPRGATSQDPRARGLRFGRFAFQFHQKGLESSLYLQGIGLQNYYEAIGSLVAMMTTRPSMPFNMLTSAYCSTTPTYVASPHTPSPNLGYIVHTCMSLGTRGPIHDPPWRAVASRRGIHTAIVCVTHAPHRRTTDTVWRTLISSF